MLYTLPSTELGGGECPASRSDRRYLQKFVVVSQNLEVSSLHNEGVSKSFRTESITKYTLTFGITR